MKITYGKKGSGKTMSLIAKCHNENKKQNNLTYIAVCDKNRAKEVFKLANKNNFNIPYPITIYELKKSNGNNIKNILIDDINDVLEYAFRRYNILECTVRKDFLKRHKKIKANKKNTRRNKNLQYKNNTRRSSKTYL